MNFDFTSLLTPSDAVESIPSGQVIFEMGQSGSVMYVMRSGMAEIRVGNQVLDVVSAGGTLGEMALLDDATRSATAIAVSACEVVPIGKVRLLEMVQQQPKVAIELTRSMVRRLRTMNHHAQYDLLTQLPNRILFQEQCHGSLARAAHLGYSVALLHLDIDNFETINDSLGYDVADRVLSQVALRLKTIPHPACSLARLGADEFAVLIEGTFNESGLEEISHAVLKSIRAPFDVQGKTIYLTASMGITCFPGDADTAEALLKNADTALHAAKENGRDRHAFFSRTLSDDAVELMNLRNDLRVAIDQGQLSLHYQPRVELATGFIDSVEALVRWHHPERGFISPAKFIPIAEDSGLIEPIGLWVLQEGCRQQQAWIAAGIAPGRMAINLSAKQLAQPHFLDTLTRAIANAGLPPDRLELEITEGALVDDPGAVAEKLRAVRGLGITVALDDFGTGYSSLSYLKRLPLDSLKIDQSFVRGIPGDGHDVAITRSIIAMAGNLQLKTVVEGIETEAQLAFAQAEGCGEFQGYLFSKPLPAEAMSALLRSRRN